METYRVSFVSYCRVFLARNGTVARIELVAGLLQFEYGRNTLSEVQQCEDEQFGIPTQQTENKKQLENVPNGN